MKAISLWQPWATLMASGAKRIETRSYQPHGLREGQLVAIHAAKHWTAQERALCAEDPFFRRYLTLAERRGLWNGAHPPLGGIVAIARFHHAEPTEALYRQLTETERAFGDYTPGRFGWVFTAVRPLAIIPARGMQGIFEWEPPRASELAALYLEPARRMQVH